MSIVFFSNSMAALGGITHLQAHFISWKHTPFRHRRHTLKSCRAHFDTDGERVAIPHLTRSCSCFWCHKGATKWSTAVKMSSNQGVVTFITQDYKLKPWTCKCGFIQRNLTRYSQLRSWIALKVWAIVISCAFPFKHLKLFKSVTILEWKPCRRFVKSVVFRRTLPI